MTNIMKCMKCGDEFPENQIQESHDVPCYLFYNVSGRRLKKQEADKYGRHWLCKKCHEEYEKSLNNHLIAQSIIFSIKYWRVEEDDRV